MSHRVHLKRMPHDVYRAYDSTGNLLYVGCSINAYRRLNQHKSENSGWVPHAYRVHVDRYADKVTARAVEAAAIAEEQPIWNVAKERFALRRAVLNLEPIESDGGFLCSDFWKVTP